MVIRNTVIHLANDLPILVDLFELPTPTDLSVRCTNVRTVDGKRPSFVSDPRSTFVFPLSMVRMIEAPAVTSAAADTPPAPVVEQGPEPPQPPPAPVDEEPDEDLLARIRAV